MTRWMGRVTSVLCGDSAPASPAAIRRVIAGAVLVLLALPAGAMPGHGMAQTQEKSDPPTGPWFGLAPPEGLTNPVTIESIHEPESIELPAEEPDAPELAGSAIRENLERIVGFSHASRARGDRLWGRVSGFRGGTETIHWVADRFRQIGLEDVRVEAFSASEEMWWAYDWEVRLLGDPTYGRGSADIRLESAIPSAGSFIRSGELTAPLVFVGEVGTAIPSNVDVEGRIAVQRVRPESGAYAVRGATVNRARSLMGRGAVGVLNVIAQSGNMHVRDFSDCYGPCFNLGAEDGAFLLQALEWANATGAARVKAKLSLDSGRLAGLSAQNAVGIVHGRSDEVVIINAHADGWFDAAGDNANGLAVLLALAEHFAAAENEPERTLVFVASAGHHSTGLNGPANFIRINPELADRAVLVLNLEHLAQLRIDSASWKIHPAEEEMSFGISNGSPFLQRIARDGVRRYGFRLHPEFTTSVPGDLGGYAGLDVARAQAIHSGPMYHTSGDVLETISTPGLERAARFFAHLLREIDMAPVIWINPE